MTTSSGLAFDHRWASRGDGRTGGDPRSVLKLLGDEYARALLTCNDEPQTARELADRCDLPLSTTYRKLDQLLDAGLFEESIRLSADGKHSTEYRRVTDRIHVSLAGDLRVECDPV